MVRPSLRTGSLRKIFRRTPGGNTVKHHDKYKPAKAKCGSCGRVLPGVPRERPYKMQRMPKTKKRPERPYGGVLCTACMRKKMVQKARTD